MNLYWQPGQPQPPYPYYWTVPPPWTGVPQPGSSISVQPVVPQPGVNVTAQPVVPAQPMVPAHPVRQARSANLREMLYPYVQCCLTENLTFNVKVS